jgi:hypothetical protein
MLTTTEAYDDTALTAAIAAATLLGADLKAGLYTVPIAITKRLVTSDLTEAAYSGYARQDVVMGAPFRDPANGISSVGGGLTWQQTGMPVPVTIVGIFYVTGAAQAVLLGVEQFANPIPLVDLLDAFTTVLQFVQSSPFPGLTTVIQ